MTMQSSTHRLVRDLYARGQHSAALQRATQWLADHPDDGRMRELEGIVLYAKQEYVQAAEALEEASLLTSLSYAGQCVLGDCFLRTKRRGLAHTVFVYLAAVPELPTSLLPLLAAGLGATGEPARALAVCRDAARRLPDEDEPLYGMAHYMAKLNYPHECVLPLLERALHLSPNCAMYRVALAVIYEKLGRLPEAYEAAKGLATEALAAQRCANCLARLARVFFRAHDWDRYRSCLTRMQNIQTHGGCGECGAD